MGDFIRIFVVCAVLAVWPASAWTRPLEIARQGYFFVGGHYVQTGAGQVMDGQMAPTPERLAAKNRPANSRHGPRPETFGVAYLIGNRLHYFQYTQSSVARGR